MGPTRILPQLAWSNERYSKTRILNSTRQLSIPLESHTGGTALDFLVAGEDHKHGPFYPTNGHPIHLRLQNSNEKDNSRVV